MVKKKIIYVCIYIYRTYIYVCIYIYIEPRYIYGSLWKYFYHVFTYVASNNKNQKKN